MKNFGLCRLAQPKIESYSDVKVKPVIDGAEIIHALVPVNKLTGLPQDIGSAIRMAVNDPKLESIVQKVLVELPAIQSDSRLSDSDKMDFIVSRFDVGTPAESDKVTSALMQLSDVLFPKQTVESQVSSSPANAGAPAEEN